MNNTSRSLDDIFKPSTSAFSNTSPNDVNTKLDSIFNGDSTKTQPPIEENKGVSLNPVKGTIDYAKGGVEKFSQGFKQIGEGADLNKPDPAKLGRGILNEAAGGLETVFSPVAAAFNTVTGGKFSTAVEEMQKDLENNKDSIPNKISDIPSFQKFAMANPHAGEVFNNLVTIVTSLMGAKEGPDIAGKVKGATEATMEKAPAIIEKGKDVVGSMKDKVLGKPTVEEAVGKVAQGSTEDVPSFARGLKNIDTKNIKTYEDLASASEKSIKDISAEQQKNLSSDKGVKRIDEFKQNVDGVEANYVNDALDQLKAHYEKVNDAKGLSKVNEYLKKANSEPSIDFETNEKTGGGLTAEDVNNIAKLHGSDLSGFNANGELASGLSKQAAENTRKGLKTTVENTLSDPEARKVFRALDKKMSDTFTVKDLTSKYAETVNKLNQKLEKPNIIQKITTGLGKAMKYTGVKSFLKEIGIGKEGSSTLNPVEIEEKLPKLLKIIDEGMKNGDDAFVREILKLGNKK